ncbi:MAG: glycoside hydrolase family 3 C-terminal domain-containing protein, partial [Candidatus Heimdallarchaeota archaeon]|nr:glycoside hydrolase family 3 C-terminal domain-containing protein [Candidatus Heimdallarchaeota archaeon]
EMPKEHLYEKKRLEKAYRNNTFTEEDIDKLVKRILRVYVKVGMFEKKKELPKGERNTKKHQNLARKMSEEGIVLLKNHRNILPLDINKITKIAILGPNANKKFGKFLYGGAAAVSPPYEITAMQGIEEKCKGKIRITKDPANSDYVLLFMGLNHDSPNKLMSDDTIDEGIEFGNESEKMDRKKLELSESQISLINKTVKINPNTIVVIINGSPVAMDDWLEKIPAVLEVWYPGMEGGRAIAKVIFGDVNPSGKLPMTFPKKITDNPAHKSEKTFPGVDLKVHYEEGIYVGYRYFDKKNVEPLFPFGYGLSYTEFKFEEVTASNNRITSMQDALEINVKITNVGNRAGAEVIQVYSEDVKCSVDIPHRELVGFEKVFLEPNETKSVLIEIRGKDLAFYDVSSNDWNLEKGDFILHIGS